MRNSNGCVWTSVIMQDTVRLIIATVNIEQARG